MVNSTQKNNLTHKIMQNNLFETISQGQKEMEDKIYALAKEKGLSSEQIQPIPDGVGNIKAYCESSPRIMWILKEPYDDVADGKPSGGEWNLYDQFDNANTWKIQTWQVIAYILYGVRNHVHWDDMPWVRNEKTMVDDLRSLALINLSKMPAYTSSPSDMTPQYETWRPILLEQLELYKPDITCFGGTFRYFKDDLGLADAKPVDGSFVYKKGNQLLLDLYHPQQTQIRREDYVNSVIDAIGKWD